MIDQTRLPLEEKFVTCRTYQEMATAIRDMIHSRALRPSAWRPRYGRGAGRSRRRAVRRGVRDAGEDAPHGSGQSLLGARTHEAALRVARGAIARGDLPRAWWKRRRRFAKRISPFAAPSGGTAPSAGAGWKDGADALCNAGALATAGYGTALGVIRAAVESGKRIDVFADETRPFLQGARLTVWELQQDSIPRPR